MRFTDPVPSFIKTNLAIFLVLAISLETAPAYAAETHPAVTDTLNVQMVPPAAERPAPRRRNALREESQDLGFLTQRRDKFQKMQNTGFGLLMGGIGAGVGGVLLMVTGLNQEERRTDQYGNTETTSGGMGLFLLGYVATVGAAPALITTGIILNRVGNHKRQYYQGEMDAQASKVSLGVGLNSLSLTYRF